MLRPRSNAVRSGKKRRLEWGRAVDQVREPVRRAFGALPGGGVTEGAGLVFESEVDGSAELEAELADGCEAPLARALRPGGAVHGAQNAEQVTHRVEWERV